jgi:hypothetical protein
MNSPPATLRRWTRGRGAALLLAGAVVLGLGARLVAQTPTALYSSDTYQYFLLAEHLVAGDGFMSGGSQHPDLSRPPLYPLGVAGVLWLVGDTKLAAQLVTALAGALAVVPLFFLARAALGPGAALAMLPLAAFSCLVGGSIRLLPTSLFTLLTLAALALTFAATQRGLTRAAFMAGILAGGAALTRGEGVIWPLLLMAWVLAAPGLVPRPMSKRLLAAGVLLGGSLLIYAPYVAWVSSRVGRVELTPSISYLVDMRDLSDRLGLRWIDHGSVPWDQRAQGLLTADHQARVLEERFSHTRYPEPDVEAVNLQFADIKPGVPATPGSLIQRRANIAAGNVRQLQVAIRYGHFAPAIIVLLALAGLPRMMQPRWRMGALFLLMGLAGSLVPTFSHVERRFLYVAFGLTLLPTAAGGSTLIHLAGRVLPGRATLARVTVATGLLILMASAAVAHAQAQRRPAEWLASQQQMAAVLAAGPAGAILAVQPSVAYRAGRPFRMVPVASPAAVLDFARAQGATQLVLEGQRDQQIRPDLAVLSGNAPPPGFTLLHDFLDHRKTRVLIYSLDTGLETTP